MKGWKVVPISKYQRLDVHPEDLLHGGDFRKCETYRGGGGYDKFPDICEKRLGRRLHTQFVVQLFGCNLDCPYCYVTRSGVWGKWKEYTTERLVKAFEASGQEIFHLMGGAPALYVDNWDEIIRALPKSAVFHSDFLLTERPYRMHTLSWLSDERDRCLFAVDIKGTTKEDYEKNTRKPFVEGLFWANLERLHVAQVPFYLTFTNPDMTHYEEMCAKLREKFGPDILADSFIIPLIEYDAVPYVDLVP
jgi:pyruvate-formate lyase-activating enzyme